MRFFVPNGFNLRALALALVAAWAVLCGQANAQFSPGFTGWTEFADSGSSAGGVVDFAVYTNTGADGSNWETQLGLTNSIASAGVLDANGGNTVDSTASFVFFYEVVNTAPATGNGSIANFNVNSYSTPYSSGGWLNNYVFNDTAITNTHPYIGTQPTGTPPDNQQYYYPSVSGQSLNATPFTNSGVTTTAPTGVASLGGAGNGGSATFQWTTFFGRHLLAASGYSPVLFLTSNTGPSYAPGSLSGTTGLNPSDGNIPTQAPEPATLLMWGAGALGLAWVSRRRHKFAGKNAVTPA